MTRKPIDGAPPSTVLGGRVDEVGSPVGTAHEGRVPTLSDALDDYDEMMEFEEEVDPFEIGGVDVGLVVASISIGSVLALLLAGLVVLVAAFA